MLNQIKQLIEACPAAPNNFKHHTGYIYYIRVYKSGETIYKVGYSYKKTFKDIAVSLKLPVDSKVELLYLSPGLPYYKVSRICKLIVLLQLVQAWAEQRMLLEVFKRVKVLVEQYDYDEPGLTEPMYGQRISKTEFMSAFRITTT